MTVIHRASSVLQGAYRAALLEQPVIGLHLSTGSIAGSKICVALHIILSKHWGG